MQAVETFRRNVSTHALGPALLVAIGLTILTATAACAGDPTSTPLPTPNSASTPAPVGYTVTFTSADGETADLRVEIADTAEARSLGLSGRESLDDDAGMLFVFEGETEAGFSMRDTLIPLSIAFISSEGVIQDIQEMAPLSTELHRPAQPYAIAVEANRGWFERNRITAGAKLKLPLLQENAQAN